MPLVPFNSKDKDSGWSQSGVIGRAVGSLGWEMEKQWKSWHLPHYLLLSRHQQAADSVSWQGTYLLSVFISSSPGSFCLPCSLLSQCWVSTWSRDTIFTHLLGAYALHASGRHFESEWLWYTESSPPDETSFLESPWHSLSVIWPLKEQGEFQLKQSPTTVEKKKPCVLFCWENQHWILHCFSWVFNDIETRTSQ